VDAEDADHVRTLTDIRDSIVERVNECNNAALLDEIERLLESEATGEPLRVSLRASELEDE